MPRSPALTAALAVLGLAGIAAGILAAPGLRGAAASAKIDADAVETAQSALAEHAAARAAGLAVRAAERDLALRRIFPAEPDFALLTALIENRGLRFGVKISDLKFGEIESPAGENFRIFPIRVAVSGDGESVKNWLENWSAEARLDADPALLPREIRWTRERPRLETRVAESETGATVRTEAVVPGKNHLEVELVSPLRVE